METQLFTWEFWGQFDTMGFNFQEVTLTQDIGPFKKGEHFDYANLNYATGQLDLSWGENETHTFNLTFQVTA